MSGIREKQAAWGRGQRCFNVKFEKKKNSKRTKSILHSDYMYEIFYIFTLTTIESIFF